MQCLVCTDVGVFVLQSVNIVRKYSSFLDGPLSFLLSKVVYVAKPSHWLTLYFAMNEHYSQFVWYRKLYVLFSRYMVINTYERLSLNMTVRTPETQETSIPSKIFLLLWKTLKVCASDIFSGKLRGPRRQFYISPVKAEWLRPLHFIISYTCVDCLYMNINLVWHSSDALRSAAWSKLQGKNI